MFKQLLARLGTFEDRIHFTFSKDDKIYFFLFVWNKIFL